VRVPTRNDTTASSSPSSGPANDDIGAAIGRLTELTQPRQAGRCGWPNIGVESVDDCQYTLAAHLWVSRREATALRFDLNRTVKEEFERRPLKAAVERRAG
jgi:hypothetical protein